jgi:hypothetical protein
MFGSTIEDVRALSDYVVGPAAAPTMEYLGEDEGPQRARVDWSDMAYWRSGAGNNRN